MAEVVPNFAREELFPTQHTEFWTRYQDTIQSMHILGVSMYEGLLRGVEVNDGKIAEKLEDIFFTLVAESPDMIELVALYDFRVKLRLLSACLHFTGAVSETMPADCARTLFERHFVEAIKVWKGNSPTTCVCDEFERIHNNFNAVVAGRTDLRYTELAIISDLAQLQTAGHTSRFLGSTIVSNQVEL